MIYFEVKNATASGSLSGLRPLAKTGKYTNPTEYFISLTYRLRKRNIAFVK